MSIAERGADLKHYKKERFGEVQLEPVQRVNQRTLKFSFCLISAKPFAARRNGRGTTVNDCSGIL